jgi:hypothetical protein
MNGKEMQIGSFGSPGGGQRGGSGKSNSPVIATLPRHVKSWLMMLAISNTLCWLGFIFGWFGFEDAGPIQAALSGIAIFWSTFCIPLQMSFIIKIDWGQKGSGG